MYKKSFVHNLTPNNLVLFGSSARQKTSTTKNAHRIPGCFNKHSIVSHLLITMRAIKTASKAKSKKKTLLPFIVSNTNEFCSFRVYLHLSARALLPLDWFLIIAFVYYVFILNEMLVLFLFKNVHEKYH